MAGSNSTHGVPLICLGRNTGTTTQSTTTALDNLPTDPKGNNFVVSSIGTTTQSTTTALDNLPTDLKGSNSVVSAEPTVRKYLRTMLE